MIMTVGILQNACTQFCDRLMYLLEFNVFSVQYETKVEYILVHNQAGNVTPVKDTLRRTASLSAIRLHSF